jgi:hypothetical protein
LRQRAAGRGLAASRCGRRSGIERGFADRLEDEIDAASAGQAYRRARDAKRDAPRSVSCTFTRRRVAFAERHGPVPLI